MRLIHCLNWGYYNFFYYVLAFDICYILGENLDFDYPFPSKTFVRRLNYKEHFSKSPHAQPDKNWIDMFVCKFSQYIYPAHKHLVLYRFFYILQEHENKAMYILAIYRNRMISHSFLKYKRCCPFHQGV
ncbi:hypothetical protein M9H77_25848 [Catharanthus roseus]|uniref:Uncharacterized protein n=1 Tax=Catharanthus roseus TaxID=4058 RepID=A0ACC0A847_CATRO|nr:hypothetical protein M9H77_25848 [Catharanthus roseus]